jgi:pyruvate-formate lyase-activating enzyme
MKIHYKRIEHERVEDAPFIGALICAVDCNINCADCFNQHLKQETTIIKESEDIINEVVSNKFNKGIILSGLEWTLQINEVRELIKLAKENNLEVILYTGLNEDKFKEGFIDIYNTPNIYFKFGRYDKELLTNDNKQKNVQLATSNQKIYKMEEFNG